MAAALIPAAAMASPADASSVSGLRRIALRASWSLTTAACLVFAALPLATETQLVFGVTMLAVLLVLRIPRRTRAMRLALIAVTSLVALRYLAWRVTSTLPDPSDPVSFGLGLVLLLAELYCAAILVISLVVNADPLERAEPAAQPDAALPTVDILIPTYNEDDTILAMTVAAARALDYPADKLTVWLLDDGGTDAKCNDPNPAKAEAARARRARLGALAQSLGAVYSTRAQNNHAKAGNLNAGLAKSKGEIVVVLDADHVPFRSFLRETIGHFAQDPRLFLVQTPHVFLNPDPIEKNLRTFDRMPSENEMFYGVTQRGLDKWNGSFFCGSAALLRRAALDKTGGFSGITITEDCETALELHAQGWTSVYVDKPLIAGLQPDTFADFIGQRSRWCQGMFQILMLKNPMLRAGLKPIQRLCYLSSITFWFFPLPRLLLMLAPLLHIFFDVKIFVSNLEETIAYTAVYMAATMVLQNALYGRLRWPLMSELYEYCQGVHLCRAVAAVIVSPKKPTFNVTAKGQVIDHDHLSPLAGPFVAIFLLLAAGVATAAWRYAFEPGTSSLMLVVGAWAAMNLVLAGAALGAVTEVAQTQRDPRLAIDRPVRLGHRGRSLAGRAIDVSASGCHIALADPSDMPGMGERITLSLADADLPAIAAEVTGIGRHAHEASHVMIAFANPASADVRVVAALMYGDPGAILRFLERRRRQKGLLAGCAEIVAWGVTGPVRALRAYVAGKRRAVATVPAVAPEPKPVTSGVAQDAPPVASREPPPWVPQIVAQPPLPSLDDIEWRGPQAIPAAAACVAANARRGALEMVEALENALGDMSWGRPPREEDAELVGLAVRRAS